MRLGKCKYALQHLPYWTSNSISQNYKWLRQRRTTNNLHAPWARKYKEQFATTQISSVVPVCIYQYSKTIFKSDMFFFLRERAKDLMPTGQETLVIFVDYKSTTLRTNPSISVAAKVLNVLQQHYVETLGRAIIVNLPMLLTFFYKGISPFLDPVTRDKVPPENLFFLQLSRLNLDWLDHLNSISTDAV